MAGTTGLEPAASAVTARGDCQTQRKSYKTDQIVGWVLGWKFHRKNCLGCCFVRAATYTETGEQSLSSGG